MATVHWNSSNPRKSRHVDFHELFRSTLPDSTLLAATAANTAIIQVPPSTHTLRTVVTTASSGDVLERVDGIHAGVAACAAPGLSGSGLSKNRGVMYQPYLLPLLTTKMVG